MVNRKIFGKIKGFLPNLNDLADVMDPLYAGEALAPLPEVIPDLGTIELGKTSIKAQTSAYKEFGTKV